MPGPAGSASAAHVELRLAGTFKVGEAAIRQVITDAGFTRFRRATETPFNLVYEVRP